MELEESLNPDPANDPASMLLRSSCLLLACAVGEAKLDFLVMADWGGQENAPFTTGGELGCGVVMGNITKTVDAKFSLAIGDNFYSHGVPGDVTDPRFENTFEKGYPQAGRQGPQSCRRGKSRSHQKYGCIHVVAACRRGMLRKQLAGSWNRGPLLETLQCAVGATRGCFGFWSNVIFGTSKIPWYELTVRSKLRCSCNQSDSMRSRSISVHSMNARVGDL